MKLSTIAAFLSAKRRCIDFNQVSLVGGLTLAVAAAIHAGALQRPGPVESTSPETPTLQATANARLDWPEARPVTLYIVDSAAQAEAAEQAAMREEAQAISPETSRVTQASRFYVVADVPGTERDVEAQVSFVSWDVWQAGQRDIAVVDLRQAHDESLESH